MSATRSSMSENDPAATRPPGKKWAIRIQLHVCSLAHRLPREGSGRSVGGGYERGELTSQSVLLMTGKLRRAGAHAYGLFYELAFNAKIFPDVSDRNDLSNDVRRHHQVEDRTHG